MTHHCCDVHRRDVLRSLGLGVLGTSCAGWLPALAAEVAQDPRRRRHCILLWMSGGPSQTDTFDMKPDHANGGEFKEIETNVAGLKFSEHLPKLAKHADQLAIIRSLSTKEGDHARGTQLVRTGHPPMADVAYPSIACSLAKELADGGTLLPNYVSVAPQLQISPAAFGPGFLGQAYAPALVGGTPPAAAANNQPAPLANLKVDDLELAAGVDPRQAERRMELWQTLERKFLERRSAASFDAHHALYRKAAEMMRPEVRAAFDLSAEPDEVRRQYGTGVFGQGCLLARRLVERGVPFVEVALGDGLGWDTHQDNFRQVRSLSEQLDAGWATLMRELKERGLHGKHHDSVDQRVRPHAEHQHDGRAGSFSQRVVLRVRRRRNPRRPGLWPHQCRRHHGGRKPGGHRRRACDTFHRAGRAARNREHHAR